VVEVLVAIAQALWLLLEPLIQAVAVAVVALILAQRAALVLSSFAIQLHTLMQLHTHQPLKQHQMGTQFIPSLPLEQSPSKEQT